MDEKADALAECAGHPTWKRVGVGKTELPEMSRVFPISSEGNQSLTIRGLQRVLPLLTVLTELDQNAARQEMPKRKSEGGKRTQIGCINGFKWIDELGKRGEDNVEGKKTKKPRHQKKGATLSKMFLPKGEL